MLVQTHQGSNRLIYVEGESVMTELEDGSGLKTGALLSRKRRLESCPRMPTEC